MSDVFCSVIIPAYNAEKSIVGCLKSFCLSRKNKLNLEVLVINDGSLDNTKQIAEKYLDSYERCSVIDKSNGGVSSARNEGIRKAKGEYLFFCDSDDKVVIDSFYKMLDVAEKTRCDIILANYLDSDSILIQSIPRIEYEKVLGRKFIIENLLSRYVKGRGPASVWNKLYKKSVVINNNIYFDENRTHGEDWAFNMDILEVSNSLFAIKDAVYCYDSNGAKIGFEKYGGNIVAGLIDGHKRILKLNERYKFFSFDSYEIKYTTIRFICFCIGVLESKIISRKDKTALLKDQYVKNALDLLFSLKDNDIPGWTKRNHFAMRLLKLRQFDLLRILNYRFKLNLIPNLENLNGEKMDGGY